MHAYATCHVAAQSARAADCDVVLRRSKVQAATEWVVHASFGAVKASTWRTVEVFDGRSYGRVPEGSLGGDEAAARVRGCELAHPV